MDLKNDNLNNSLLDVAALYQFVEISNIDFKRRQLIELCRDNNIKGTIIIAEEGINGTIAGKSESLLLIINHIRDWSEIDDLEVKYSSTTTQTFHRLKVKSKQEIVTMGKKNIDPKKLKGDYIDPIDWNDFIQRDDVILIDARNIYETQVGKFFNAIDPEIDHFKEFPEWVENFIQDIPEDKKIAMYCTGGIRCEKASSYLKKLGHQEVYQLKGGILKYLEVVSKDVSLWEGECFVFDGRVSLKHGLEEGTYSLCFGCQFPVSERQRQSPFFEDGVTCDHCYHELTEKQKEGSRERRRQISLSKERGEVHIGKVFGNTSDISY